MILVKNGASEIPEHFLTLPFLDNATIMSYKFQTRFLLQHRNFISSDKRSFMKFEEDYINKINAIMCRIESITNLVLQYPPLKLDSLKRQIYSIFCRTNNMDKTSQLKPLQLWLIVKTCAILCTDYFISPKALLERFLGRILWLFRRFLSIAYTLNFDFERILGMNLPIRMLTDS